MRTFIIRARNGTTRWEQLKSNIGIDGHVEILAHSIINAFYVSNAFRTDVEVYVILDSAADFPRTIKLSGADGLSIAGFHELAVLEILENALKQSSHLRKDEKQWIAPGVEIFGFGFERLVSPMIESRPVYLLEPKGEDIRTIQLGDDPVFILSDHIALPKNIVKSFKRRGVNTISLGKKMLFASQCVVLINHEMDRSC